jgi:signal transduction histidine kinase/CHASE3 domain sensor protein
VIPRQSFVEKHRRRPLGPVGCNKEQSHRAIVNPAVKAIWFLSRRRSARSKPLDTPDPSRVKSMKDAVLRFRERLAGKPFPRCFRGATLSSLRWIALAPLIAVAVFSYLNSSSLIETNRTQIQLRMLVNELQRTVFMVDDAETGQRGYLLVGDESYLAPYLKAVQIADQETSRFDQLMIAFPEQRSKVDGLQRLVAMKFAELKETIRLRKSVGIEAAMEVVRTGRGKGLMDEIRSLADQITIEVQGQLTQCDLQIVRLSTNATRWSVLGTVLAAVLFASVLHRERREHASIEAQKQELAESVEALRILTLAQSQGEIESLAQQARDLADFVQNLQEQTLLESDNEIEALRQEARDLAAVVEASRLRTLDQSDRKLESLGQTARALARNLAVTVETSRVKTLDLSDRKIAAMGQTARDLATSVESSRVQTLDLSDQRIEAMGQTARDLATSVESSRVQTLDLSDRKIEAMGQTARDLATFVESSRVQTLDVSDRRIEALGQTARDLATSVESSRRQTLSKSDRKIEAMGQQARDMATSVEGLRKKALTQAEKERRKLNFELEQRVTLLETANNELESFSYSISHDLRAPLRAIDGFSRIVLEDYSASLAEEGKKYLQLVRDNTRQMGQLVDDLLSFSRLGRQPLAKHPVDVDKLVRRCLEEMAKDQQGRQVEIIIGELPACNADPNLIKQVWTNLIANALKYSRKREIARIEIGCRLEHPAPVHGMPALDSDSDAERVYFVKDNGAGFDMKYAHKLFGVFQRLHRAADYEGTGVGLAIVQRIVQRHGGRIWADAKPDEGATFSFTIE